MAAKFTQICYLLPCRYQVCLLSLPSQETRKKPKRRSIILFQSSCHRAAVPLIQRKHSLETCSLDCRCFRTTKRGWRQSLSPQHHPRRPRPPFRASAPPTGVRSRCSRTFGTAWTTSTGQSLCMVKRNVAVACSHSQRCPVSNKAFRTRSPTLERQMYLLLEGDWMWSRRKT